MYGEKSSMIVQRLPHACGGVSNTGMFRQGVLLSSPRMWGCFYLSSSQRMADAVFPTHVGVFLQLFATRLVGMRLPHACGGVSACRLYRGPGTVSSPRMWGCFRIEQLRTRLKKVFPTHVGRATKPPSSRSGAFPLFYSRQLTLGRSVS